MNKYLSDMEAKNLVCEIGHRMWEKQMVAANDGNITVRVGANAVIATPTGVSKGELTPEMLFKIDLDGNILEEAPGYSPTSETVMHLTVYKQNKEAMSTCHAHCLYLSAFASAGIDLDLATAPEPAMITGRIPVVPYACPGTKELADSIIPYIKDHKVVLLSNHGPIAWGNTPKDAWYTLESAEAYARTSLILKYIMKDIRPLSKNQLDQLEEKFHTSAESNRVKASNEITNMAKGRSLDKIDVTAISLSEESLERLADILIQKMEKNCKK